MPVAIIERNELATKIMAAQGVAIDDLYAFMLPHTAKVANPQDVHFKNEGYDLLGGQVAASIRLALSGK